MDGISGLQSLISRGMRNPTQRAPIPPGLQALIQAQQALKQTAAPVTPGGMPTIAGQTEQAIQQQLQPATPQMGQPQAQVVGQGIPQAAQAAGIAAQQQQAQQQQALQQAMQMAQQQPQQPQPDQTQQQMAEGGIAGLPADNMSRMEQYAHGGVIGFDGEDGSFVDRLPEESWLRKVADWIKAGRPSLEKPLLDGAGESAPASMTGPAITPPATDEAAVMARRHPEVGSATPGYNIDTLIAQQAAQKAAKPAGAPRVGSVGAGQAPMTLQMSPEEREAFNWVKAERDKQYTEERPDQAKMRAQLEAERAAQGLTGLIGSRTEEAIKAAAARDEALRQKYQAGLADRESENRIAAFTAARMGGLGGLGETYVSRAGAQRAADLQFEQLMNASAAKRDEMVASVDAMREAQASGNTKDYRAAEQQYLKSAAEYRNAQRLLGTTGLEAATRMQEGALNRQVQREQIASHERIARLQLEGKLTPRQVYDTINDNVQKEMDAWGKLPTSAAASAAERQAVLEAAWKRQVEMASALGVNVPEAVKQKYQGAGSSTQLKYNPATGKIE